MGLKDAEAVKLFANHAIFLSQATSPFKGLHKVLEALPAVLRCYPDAKVRIPAITASRIQPVKLRYTKKSSLAKFLSEEKRLPL